MKLMADMANRKTTAMPPPGMKSEPKTGMKTGMDEKIPDEPENAAKVSESEAIVLRADDRTCRSCANYEPMDGSCSRVEGSFDPGDRCLRFYESGKTEDEGEGDED